MPVSPSRVTAGEWIAAAARRLRRAHAFFGHGAATAEEEALWLLAHASRTLPQRMLGVSRWNTVVEYLWPRWGGIAGNLFFGFYLGLASAFGTPRAT